MKESGRGLSNHIPIKRVVNSDLKLVGEVDELLTAAFEVPQGESTRTSYFDDFPIWRPGSSNQASLSVAVDSQGQLQGCAGLRLAQLKSSGTEHPRLGLVGAVATHRTARGTGIATRMMEFCIQEARSKGCQAVVLWDSSGSSLYKRLGFREFGHQSIVRLAAFARNESPQKSGVVRRGWHDELFPLLKNRATGLVLEAGDLNWVRLHRNTQWYSLWERGRPIAACAIGRGIDLQGVVHEWHGSAEELQTLFMEVLKDHPGALLVGPETGDITLAAHRIPMGLVLPLHSGVDAESWWFWGLDSV